jgi:hypothetical protein
MGHEFKGGYLREMAKASQMPVQLSIVESQTSLRVRGEIVFDGETIIRELIFSCNDPRIRGKVTGRAPARTSIMLRFTPAFSHSRLQMVQPGGVIERPLVKIYAPTYWPMQNFVHAWTDEEQPGFAMLTTQPTAVASLDGQSIEWIPLRNATHETAFGFIGIPANPATGFEKQSCTFEYAFGITTKGSWQENALESGGWQLVENTRSLSQREAINQQLQQQVSIKADFPVNVTALKHAHHGQGWILRLRAYRLDGDPVQVMLPSLRIHQAWLCDAREQDIAPLEVIDGWIHVPMKLPLASLRLLGD